MAKNKKIVIILSLLTIAMFGFGYALVPLYNVLCQVTGINGKSANVVDSASDTIDYSRTIKVDFITTLNANLAWKFYPLVTEISLHPGENKRVAFFAENDSGKTMTVQAIPSIAPNEAAKYLKKTECFCFTQQTLANGQALDMPVIFHIDPKLPKEISEITLSYTLFDAGKFKPVSKDKAGKL